MTHSIYAAAWPVTVHGQPRRGQTLPDRAESSRLRRRAWSNLCEMIKHDHVAILGPVAWRFEYTDLGYLILRAEAPARRDAPRTGPDRRLGVAERLDELEVLLSTGRRLEEAVQRVGWSHAESADRASKRAGRGSIYARTTPAGTIHPAA